MCFVEEVPHKHVLMACKRPNSEKAKEVYENTRRTIKYERYSCCFQCGLPQEVCQRYEQRASQGYWQLVSEQQCQYPEVVMPTLIGLTIAGGERFGETSIQRMADEGVDVGSDEEVNGWLGGKIRWGGLESNRLTREFYRVVKAVERQMGKR